MATKDEFEQAFAKVGPIDCIKVQSKSGKEYWMHPDQFQFLPDGLVYGVPVKPHFRSTRKTECPHSLWLYPENITIVPEED
jgi:hypothetical protein